MHFNLPSAALLALASLSQVSALGCNTGGVTWAAVGGISGKPATICNDVDGSYSGQYQTKSGCRNYGENHVNWWVQKRSDGSGTLNYNTCTSYVGGDMQQCPYGYEFDHGGYRYHVDPNSGHC